jgi:hypothetical protein
MLPRLYSGAEVDGSETGWSCQNHNVDISSDDALVVVKTCEASVWGDIAAVFEPLLQVVQTTVHPVFEQFTEGVNFNGWVRSGSVKGCTCSSPTATNQPDPQPFLALRVDKGNSHASNGCRQSKFDEISAGASFRTMCLLTALLSLHYFLHLHVRSFSLPP